MSDQDQQEDKRDTRQGENGADPGHASASDRETADRRLADVEAERDEMKDRMLRVAADFENWKKRARKEQEDAESKARESVLKDMLDVMDNLERATSAYGSPGGNAGAPDGAAVLKGVGLVLRLFQSKLERYGVKVIDTQGQPFDPRIHEAISRTETADVPAGRVASELQRGYRIGDRLLRPSMVSVAVAPATAAAAASAGHAGVGGVGDKIS